MSGHFLPLGEWWRRLQMMLFKRRFERDLDQEIALHLEYRAEEYTNLGHSPQEAKLLAMRRFGSPLLVREDARATWGWRWLDDFLQDARYGVRVLLRRDAAVTAVVVVTLGLTIGMASAMFAVVDNVLIRRPPYRDPDALAMLWTANRAQGLLQIGTGYPVVEQWRALNRTFDDLAVASRTHVVTIPRDDGAERVQGAVVSANLFSILGLPPALGRTISVDDESAHRRVVVVSASFWKERWGSSESTIGSALDIDGVPTTVIGVMPASFQFPSKDTQLWEPLTSLRNWDVSRTYPYSHFWITVGRLRPNTTMAAAQTDMTAVGHQVSARYPAVDVEKNSAVSFDVNVVPLRLQMVDANVRASVLMLFGAVVVVLLIACSNVANILLARGTARRRELAIRMAIGGGRARLVRQMLTEALLLGGLGGGLGIGLAAATMHVFRSLGAATVPRLEETVVDVRVMAFTVAVSIGVALAFGLAPALEAAGDRAGETLKAGGQMAATSSKRLRTLLIIGEFALALVLLAVSSLLVRSLLQALSVETGFRPESVLVARVEYPRAKSDASAISFYQGVLDRIERLPGVLGAGLVSRFVIDTNPDDVITVEGRAPLLNEQLWDDSVSPGYFRAVGTPLLRGRSFTETDTRIGPRVAIVNQTMARRFWRDEDPIGRRFRMGIANANEPWITVVGVVADMRRQGLERNPISQIFVPHAQSPGPGMLREVDLLVRTASDPLGYQSVIRSTLHNLDPSVPMSRVTTLARQMDRWTAPRRFQTALLTVFSALALTLAALGIYGLLHYAMIQRTREIGIRIALGASRMGLLRGVLMEGLTLAGIGAATGLVGMVLVGRALRGLLFNVSQTDPASIAAAVAILAVTALAGCLLPAVRTTSVDPLIVLKTD